MSGPEFGPRGYLPPRAAKRARKIVLREQMGWGWPLAAALAAVLVAIAGVVYLVVSTRPPQAPFTAVGPIAAVPPGGAEVLRASDGRLALVVRAAGSVRAFAPPDAAATWCEESRRIESDDAAWLPDGRRVHGDAPSLERLASVVHDGGVFVDFTSELGRPPPGPQGAPPACAD